MGPEELKAIVEMIGGLGASTMYGFITYLVFQILVTIISYGVGVFGIIVGYKVVQRIINAVQNESNSIKLLKRFKNTWRVTGDYSELYNSDFVEIEEKISELESQAREE